MSHIELRNVHKRYGEVRVLHDINLQIEPGEFCVFIGPSGCGKSTLLRMIAGLEEISDGTLSLDGKVVNELPPAQRNVAMVFQSYALYPHMSVKENMAFGLRHTGLAADEIERRVTEAGRSLHLDTLLDRKPRELSGGQRQRVAIGRAIVRQPKVFLFDEPLSNLDAALRIKTRVEIARLHRELGAQGTAMVYVTHDQVEAMTLADKIVLLRPDAAVKGQPSIAQVGHPLELYHHPANLFVAGFIGSPAMNFLQGSVTQVSAGRVDGRLAGGERFEAEVAGTPMLRPGAAVTVGIRPEHVLVSAGGAAQPGTLQGTVSHREHLGELTQLYLQVPGQEGLLLAKGQMPAVRLGDAVAFTVPAADVHVFDEHGQAVTRPPQGERARLAA